MRERNEAVKDDTPSEHDPDSCSYRRNFWLIVGNGVITSGALAFFDPSLVIGAFIVQMNAPDLLVGIAGTVAPLGFSWPQLFVANLIASKPRKLFLYRWGMVGRMASLAALIWLMWALRHNLPGWFPYVLVGLLFVHWSFTGISAVPWYEVLSKAIPPEERPVVFAWRQSGGQLMAMFAGGIISWALSERSGLPFPNNYLFLLVLMTIFMGIGLWMFCIVREPVDPNAVGRKRPWGEYFRLGPQIVREDENYRRLLIGYFSFAVAFASTPFMVPFLIRRVGTGDRVVGPLMILTAGVSVVMAAYYGWLGRRRGNRAVLVQASRLGFVSPALGLLAGVLPPVRVFGLDARLLLIALALMCSRIASTAMMTGRNNYLLDIAPPPMRPTYVGFWMAFALLTTLVPMLAGAVVELMGYTFLFALCAAFGIASMGTIVRLIEPREQGIGSFARREDVHTELVSRAR